MILAFLQYGNRPLDVSCARVMLESKKQWMPQLKTLHMCTPGTKNLGNRAQIATYEDDDFYGTYAARHFAYMHAVTDEIIVADVDVVFRADIRDLFNESDFDVAMAARESDHPAGKYIGGFILSRNAQFWKDVEVCVNQQPGPFREWMGIQLALVQVAKNYRVLELDSEIYNYAPSNSADIGAGAKVVHYRGDRKEWMILNGTAATDSL